MPTNKPYYSDPAVLFTQFKQGQTAALQYIFEIHSHALASFVLRLVKDCAVRDDIISESFLKCWERRENFDSLEGIKYFLFSIVRNSSVNYLRMSARHAAKKEEILLFQAMNEADVDAEEIRAELLQEVMVEVAALPPKMKRVFELLYFDQKSYEQVADALDISVHTAKAQRSAAVAKIRRNLTLKGIFRIWFF